VSAHRRGPRPLAAALERIQAELSPETVLAQSQQAWPGVVGEQVAAQAGPTAERGGVLTIGCSAAVWAHELDLMAPSIIERLNELVGKGRIRRLRCVAVQRSDER
jgi:predicted nucleic acid-binding Zn ribbon protein